MPSGAGMVQRPSLSVCGASARIHVFDRQGGCEQQGGIGDGPPGGPFNHTDLNHGGGREVPSGSGHVGEILHAGGARQGLTRSTGRPKHSPFCASAVVEARILSGRFVFVFPAGTAKPTGSK